VCKYDVIFIFVTYLIQPITELCTYFMFSRTWYFMFDTNLCKFVIGNIFWTHQIFCSICVSRICLTRCQNIVSENYKQKFTINSITFALSPLLHLFVTLCTRNTPLLNVKNNQKIWINEIIVKLPVPVGSPLCWVLRESIHLANSCGVFMCSPSATSSVSGVFVDSNVCVALSSRPVQSIHHTYKIDSLENYNYNLKLFKIADLILAWARN